MKMAKASEADIDMALKLSTALESLERYGYMPEGVDGDERFDADNPDDCKRALAHILSLVRSASLFRVTFGMAVVLDLANEIVDPASDTLALHPKHCRTTLTAKQREDILVSAGSICDGGMSPDDFGLEIIDQVERAHGIAARPAIESDVHG